MAKPLKSAAKASSSKLPLHKRIAIGIKVGRQPVASPSVGQAKGRAKS